MYLRTFQTNNSDRNEQTMNKKIQPVEPKKLNGKPAWFNPNGGKLFCTYSNEHILQLKSGSVDATVNHDTSDGNFFIRYEIRHPKKSMTTGRVDMTKLELLAAFGISAECDVERGQKILNNHGGDRAAEGVYIRYLKFLNTPSPGTGYGGDPSLSIYLSDEVIAGVKRLVGMK